MKVAIYMRVSKSDGSQNVDRQKKELMAYCKASKWRVVECVEEYVSGRKKNRIGVDKIVSLAKGNKIQKVVIHEISRLGRNLADVVQTVEILSENKVSVFDLRQRQETLDENYNKTIFATIILPLLSGIAEEYAQQQSYRIKSGLKNTKKTLGRPKGRPIKHQKKVEKCLKNGMSLRNTAKEAQVSLFTVQKIKKIMAENG